MRQIITAIIILSQFLLLSACSDIIEYSPYDTNIKTHDINIINAAKITDEQGALSDTVRFALFSDVHENYDDMSDAISSINRQSGVQFVVCCGDITCSGLTQEFEWDHDAAEKSIYPLITVIGNHDHLLNGNAVFNKLFGPPNMSFISGKYKFVLFNNNLWENYNYSPKYEWLRNQLSDSDYSNIIISHIPPFADEIDDLHRLVYNQIVDTTNTILSIHGHFHCFSDTVYNGIHTIISGAIDSREYYIVTLNNDKVFIECLSF